MVTDARQTFSSSLGACPSLVLVLLWCCIGRCSAGDQTLMRAPLVCNSTFNEPLVPDLLRNCRTPALKDKAQELVASGKGSVWFKPARKAGGMTVQSFLREVHQRKQGTTFHAVEWQLLPTKCLATDPFHVYITILREPISRFRSLFFFDGPEKGIRQRPSSEPRPQGVPSTPGEVRGRSGEAECLCLSLHSLWGCGLGRCACAGVACRPRAGRTTTSTRTASGLHRAPRPLRGPRRSRRILR